MNPLAPEIKIVLTGLLSFSLFDNSVAVSTNFRVIRDRMGSVIPDLPRCGAVIQFFQALFVLKRVHALPKSGALVGQEGARFDEALKWRAHQLFAGLDIAEDFIAHDEESTVDPDVSARQRGNIRDHTFRADVDNVKAGGGLHQQQRGDCLGFAKRIDHSGECDIAQPIAIIGKEHFFALEVRLHGFQALADVGVDTGLDKCNRPVIDVTIQEVDFLAALGPDKIVGNGLVVVEKIILNRVAAIPEAENEVLVAKVRVILHQVPNDRAGTDLHHGFRNIIRVTPETHAGSATKQDNFHESPQLASPCLVDAYSGNWNDEAAAPFADELQLLHDLIF